MGSVDGARPGPQDFAERGTSPAVAVSPFLGWLLSQGLLLWPSRDRGPDPKAPCVGGVLAPWALAAASTLALSCGGSAPPATATPPPPVDLSQPWATASPESERIDPGGLATAFARAETTAGLRSLLVARNGRLVGETYLAPASPESLEDGRSVTKSVTSLLVGVAIDEGVIRGTEERLDVLLPPPVADASGSKAAITVENLLTMTSGFAWDESTAAGYNAWILAPDQIDFLLSRPLSDPPGQRFNYDSAAVHLLSVGLAEAAGAPTRTFAERHLFAPLGIGAYQWERDTRGYENGASGLSLRARDLAKVGQLVLQDGASADRQLVPSAWIRSSLTSHVATGARLGSVGSLSYGYLWWLTTLRGHAVAFAWGYRGQFVFLVPDLQLVVVATSALDAPLPSDEEAAGVFTLIVDGVLPTVE
jgi:CubicO group peptidase (beta-lactamase class C family)